jgi:GTP:adenosylcobinamide-phosphate guanylyltransferase
LRTRSLFQSWGSLAQKSPIFRGVTVPAVVAAGDRRAAKAVYGESKVYLELGGLPLVAHVVAALQRVPEVSEVWVVGDPERLAEALGSERLRAELRKPLHIIPQFRNLYENAWESYRRLLPGAGPQGRDPGPADEDLQVLYLSADLPFATPQEIGAFVREGMRLDVSYALGLVSEEAMTDFAPRDPGEPGIRMAYFNLREGRFRQSNLHLVRPARIVNRHYIEEMYEHRYQKQFGNIVGLAWRLLRDERGGVAILYYYGLMHLAAILDRWGLRRLADVVRGRIPIQRIEAGVSTLLRASFRFVATQAGGCAVDIDNEEDFDAARARFEQWRALQQARAERLYGPVALPASAGGSGP